MEGKKYTGLTRQEVVRSRNKYGTNELRKDKRANIFQKIWSILKEPIFLILTAAAVIYFFIGKPSDAAIMLVSVLVVIGLDFLQTEKTNRAIAELDKLSALYIEVIRDGKKQQIDSRKIVNGDVIVLKEGDKVPADCQVVKIQSLGIDESTLTGESEVVYKSLEDRCFAGTYVVSGSALAVVTAVGEATELGKIGKSFRDIKPRRTPLMQQFGKITAIFAAISITMCFVIAIVTFITAKDADFAARLTKALLAGIAISIAALPEEIPLVLTVFLALGAQKLARQKTLTKNIQAIENLGAITVLCADKTGTLTESHMEVVETYALRKELHQGAYFACVQSDFEPMDMAIKKCCSKHLKVRDRLSQLEKTYPFTPETKMFGQVWTNTQKSNKLQHLLCVKGAYEVVLPLCQLTVAEKKKVQQKIDEYTTHGYRVLAVANKTLTSKIPAKLPHSKTYTFLGLIALANPLRHNVQKSLEKCQKAGVRLIMITGDSKKTAQSIAQQIGLDDSGGVLMGDEIEKLSDEKLRQRVREVNIFCRVYPNHKMRIVTALQQNHEVMAMTGDGVNDAPALKKADIGIAMGKNGTHVAKEAADLILLDDNLHTIVNAIEQGRTIYCNIKKAVSYIFIIHIPIILLAFAVPLFGWPVLLLPVHLVLMEFLIDPTCSIIFQRLKPERDVMREPPRSLCKPMITKKTFLRCLVQGGLLFGAIFFAYGCLLATGLDAKPCITIAYVALIIAAILLAYQLRSGSNLFKNIMVAMKDKVTIFVNATILFILCLIVYLPFFNDTAETAPIGMLGWVLAILIALLAIVPAELFKRKKRH